MTKPAKYDYLIVGAGLYGATVAYRIRQAGKRALVIDRRDHTGGNVRCENVGGIDVHRYGAHIFHTSNREVWDFVNRFATFNRFTNSPIANFKGRLYNLPFNMNTFHALWGVVTPAQAREIIDRQRRESGIGEPSNLEEQAISLVGRDIYETLVKGYTEKQWGRPCSELPPEIIRRLPVRFTFDNNYFDDLYQGIPVGGYNPLIDALLDGTEVRLGCDFFAHRDELEAISEHTIYTGEIDRYYDYRFGRLEYRSLRFESETLAQENFQGVAVMNFTDAETPYTRIIEHKHFAGARTPHTVITREYPQEWTPDREPYYPINDARNGAVYAKYKAAADADPRTTFGGRLAEYRYYDMHQVIERALKLELKP